MMTRVSEAPSLRVASMAVGVFAFVVILLHEPWHQPLLYDRAYFAYMAQALLRGEPLYQATTFGYAPLGVFVSAAAMKLGAWIGMADYIAPRIVAVPLAAASAGLLCMVTARFAGSVWTGVVAGVTLSLFDLFNAFASANLEPKMLVLFLALVAVAAAQAGRWWIVGLGSSLAAMAWQPAAIMGLAMLALAIANRAGRGRRPLGEYLLGAVIGLAPVILYLLTTGQVEAFVRQAVLFKLQSRPDLIGATTPHPLSMLLTLSVAVGPVAVLVLVVAGVGVGAFAWRAVRLPKEAMHDVLRPSSGGLVLLTAAWAAYATASAVARAESQSSTDVVPFFYLPAFWFAYAIGILGAPIPNADVGRTRKRRVPVLPVVAAVVATLALGKAAAYRVRLPLEQQVRWIQDAGRGRTTIAINLPEFYAITGTRAPWRSMLVTPYFMQFVERQAGIYCEDLQRAVEKEGYERILVRTLRRWNPGCLTELVTWLEARYVRWPTTTRLGFATTCGTASLLRLRRDRSLAVDTPPDPRAWASCVMSRASGYQFGDDGDILVFDRNVGATPADGRP